MTNGERPRANELSRRELHVAVFEAINCETDPIRPGYRLKNDQILLPAVQLKGNEIAHRFKNIGLKDLPLVVVSLDERAIIPVSNIEASIVQKVCVGNYVNDLYQKDYLSLDVHYLGNNPKESFILPAPVSNYHRPSPYIPSEQHIFDNNVSLSLWFPIPLGVDKKGEENVLLLVHDGFDFRARGVSLPNQWRRIIKNGRLINPDGNMDKQPTIIEEDEELMKFMIDFPETALSRIEEKIKKSPVCSGLGVEKENKRMGYLGEEKTRATVEVYPQNNGFLFSFLRLNAKEFIQKISENNLSCDNLPECFSSDPLSGHPDSLLLEVGLDNKQKIEVRAKVVRFDILKKIYVDSLPFFNSQMKSVGLTEEDFFEQLISFESFQSFAHIFNQIKMKESPVINVWELELEHERKEKEERERLRRSSRDLWSWAINELDEMSQELDKETQVQEPPSPKQPTKLQFKEQKRENARQDAISKARQEDISAKYWAQKRSKEANKKNKKKNHPGNKNNVVKGGVWEKKEKKKGWKQRH